MDTFWKHAPRMFLLIEYCIFVHSLFFMVLISGSGVLLNVTLRCLTVYMNFEETVPSSLMAKVIMI